MSRSLITLPIVVEQEQPGHSATWFTRVTGSLTDKDQSSSTVQHSIHQCSLPIGPSWARPCTCAISAYQQYSHFMGLAYSG